MSDSNYATASLVSERGGEGERVEVFLLTCNGGSHALVEPRWPLLGNNLSCTVHHALPQRGSTSSRAGLSKSVVQQARRKIARLTEGAGKAGAMDMSV